MFYEMTDLTTGDTRRVHENVIKMMAADAVVNPDRYTESEGGANNAWFMTKERLTVPAARQILVEAGIASFVEAQ